MKEFLAFLRWENDFITQTWAPIRTIKTFFVDLESQSERNLISDKAFKLIRDKFSLIPFSTDTRQTANEATEQQATWLTKIPS